MSFHLIDIDHLITFWTLFDVSKTIGLM